MFNKGEFRDRIRLRYGKELSRMPRTRVCGTDMSINHALNCPRGGYVIIRHNEVRDFLAHQLSNVCKDVTTEPELQTVDDENFSRQTTLTGEHAKPDIRARGFYRAGQYAYFDIKLLNPNSESYMNTPTSKVYQNAERAKRSLYNECIINVEHGTFCPLVFSVTGGAGPEAKTFLRLLCNKIAKNSSSEYVNIMSFLKCKLSFLMRRLVLLCIRGSRLNMKNNSSTSYESDFDFGCFVSKL